MLYAQRGGHYDGAQGRAVIIRPGDDQPRMGPAVRDHVGAAWISAEVRSGVVYGVLWVLSGHRGLGAARSRPRLLVASGRS